jgi:hypothetical protein
MHPSAGAARGPDRRHGQRRADLCREFEEQAEIDTERTLSDPMVIALIGGDTNTITGTRLIDGVRYDALDKRINMEVIQQEAKKEGIYPTEAQIRLCSARSKPMKCPLARPSSAICKI